MTPPPAALRPLPVACLAVVGLLLAASGCGEESTGAAESSAARQASAKAADRPRAEAPAAAGCPTQLDSFVDALDALRRRLAVGLSYEQYSAQLKSLRASYGEIPVQRLTFACLVTGTPGERALNKHVEAANAWGECLADASCTTAAIEPVLQRKWRIASRHLAEAQPRP